MSNLHQNLTPQAAKKFADMTDLMSLREVNALLERAGTFVRHGDKEA
jgi:hypothetical protein